MLGIKLFLENDLVAILTNLWLIYFHQTISAMILIFIKDDVKALELCHISSNDDARDLGLHRFRWHLCVVSTSCLVIKM